MAELRSVTPLEPVIARKDSTSEANVNKAFYQLHPEYGLIGLNGSPFLDARTEQKLVNPENVKTLSSDIEASDDAKEPPLTKAIVIKNLIVISFAFLILFTAFHSNAHLHHNLDDNHNLGTASLSVVYASMIISCLFVPHLFISLFGLKLTIMISIVTYAIYFSANFDFTYQALIPSSLILGIGGAPLWTANCIYITELGKLYSVLAAKDEAYHTLLGLMERMVTKFFAIFFMVFQTGQVWGNMIAHGLFLQPQQPKPNGSLITCETTFFSCVYNFRNKTELGVTMEKNVTNSIENSTASSLFNKLPFESHSEWFQHSYNQIDSHDSNYNYFEYLFPGVYTASALLAAGLIWLFLIPIGSQYESSNLSLSFLKEIFVRNKTLMQLKHPYQALLIPITIFSGLEQAFIVNDFAKALHNDSCFNVSYILICFGVSNAFVSLTFGCLVKYTGRITKVVLGAALSVAAIVTLYITEHYVHNFQSRFLYYIVAALWGAGDAIWQTQINSIYGVFFIEEERVSAFCNYRMWESVGFLLAYTYAHADICSKIKIMSLAVCLFLGVLAYLGIELHMVKPEESSRNLRDY